jgi:hypothetical protein
LDLHSFVHCCTRSCYHFHLLSKNFALQPFQQWSYHHFNFFYTSNHFSDFLHESFPLLTLGWWWWCQRWNCFQRHNVINKSTNLPIQHHLEFPLSSLLQNVGAIH